MIIDVNALLGRWPFYTLRYEGVEGIVALMDRAGIDKAVVTSMDSVYRVDYETGNREVAEACKQYPDRFIPFAVINPIFTLWKEHLKTCVKEFGAKGIKLHPDYHKYGLLGEEIRRLMEEAKDYALPVYVQTSLIDHRNLSRYRPFYCNVDETPARDVASLIRMYLENKIIVGFAQRGGDKAIELLKQVQESKNLYIETSVMDAAPFDAIEETVKAYGSSRLLFGTRMPLLIPEAAKAVIEKSKIAKEDKEKILGRNAAELLSITE